MLKTIVYKKKIAFQNRNEFLNQEYYPSEGKYIMILIRKKGEIIMVLVTMSKKIEQFLAEVNPNLSIKNLEFLEIEGEDTLVAILSDNSLAVVSLQRSHFLCHIELILNLTTVYKIPTSKDSLQWEIIAHVESIPEEAHNG